MNTACRHLREQILKISHKSGHGHVPSCFSVVEILYALYGHMRHNPLNPNWEKRDLFLLSKGHGSLAHYVVLANAGYFPVESVYAFGSFESDFGCHPDRFKVPGVEASTGSLGHGIGIAVGAAFGALLKRSGQNVYTLIGDGEANEGTVWEALLVAADLNLSNLTVILDNNKSQGRALQIPEPAKKFASFGCQATEVDGHDLAALEEVLSEAHDRPKAIVANTVKGFGCNTLAENHYEWHRKSPTDEQLAALLEELDETPV